jgi:hypothetical protein
MTGSLIFVECSGLDSLWQNYNNGTLVYQELGHLQDGQTG